MSYRPRNLRAVVIGTLLMAGVLAACGGAGTPEAQSYTIGVLNHASSLNPTFEGFRAGMAALGYQEGEQITYLYGGPAGSVDALGPVAEELQSQDLDLLITIGTPPSVLAKETFGGTDLPIVFVPVNDPVATGIVDDLQSPGGNMTGIQNRETVGRAIEWLVDLTPGLSVVYVPHNPEDGSSVISLEALSAAAEEFDLELIVTECTTSDEVSAAAQDIPDEAGAIFLVRSGAITSHASEFIEAANDRRIPVASTVFDLVDQGALITYGTDYYHMGEQAAGLADQILRGIPPADLPIETGEPLLGINLAAAMQLSLEVSDDSLQQADTVVRDQE